MAGEEGIDGPVGLSHLAEMLHVSPVSANQMVKKLVGRGLVEYLPYKGTELTAAGRAIADQVLRGRRLWSLFLVEQLGLSVSRSDAIACDLEHITPPDLADRLTDLLGDPKRDPQGRPIPSSDRTPATGVSLPDLPVGTVAPVVAVEGTAASTAFLKEMGVVPGSEVTLLAVSDTGDCLLAVEGREIQVAAPLARRVLVVGR
jgi:DtxR family Mn-dependent transcriptional regulator